MNIDIQIERWPIERLIPRANNPRTHSREQVANIAASIREGDGRTRFLLAPTATSSRATHVWPQLGSSG
jgi:hypothetical protein